MPTLHSAYPNDDFAISANMSNQSSEIDYELDFSGVSLWRDFCEIIYPNINTSDNQDNDSTHLTQNLQNTQDSQNPQDLKDSQNPQNSQKNPPKHSPKDSPKNSKEMQSILQNPQQLAIILSTNTQNFDTFAKSDIFASILQDFAQNISQTINKDFKQDFTLKNDSPPNLATLQSIQKHILSHLSPLRLVALSPYILRLNSANLLSIAHTRALLELFERHAKKHKSHQNPSKKSLNLKSLQSELHSLIKQLETIGISKIHSQALDNILQKNANQSFSIGITGVLSAGKSTFLNALLGREILGTSTIPETANLSILRPIMLDNAQNKKADFARVHFWSKKEWAEFETCDNQTSQNHISSNMSEFVRATKEAFGDRLEALLAQGQKDIDIRELRDYTSANSPTKYCNLIKKVELFMALPFLQNQHANKDFASTSSDIYASSHNVEIVDTPGLDDPIRAREKITREFISHCDLLIHIMNASCAATQVDMDFILESLLSLQVSRLLVVLSRSDLLSQKELESSLAYTRNSLAKELTKARFDGDIDALLSRIDFIPLSSFFALGYTSNNAQIIAQASAKGYDKEKTGITQVQDYLDNALLGENSQKQRDILYRAYRSVSAIVSAEIEEVGIKLSLSSASKDELESIIQSTKTKQENLMRSFEMQKKEFGILSDELESYLLGLEKIITTSLHTHKSRLNSLIYDDMLYETSRGNAPTKERIQQMLGVQVEDISSDLSREYRYKSAQKIASLQANITSAKMDLLESNTKNELDSADLATKKSDLSTNNYVGASMQDEVLSDIKSSLVDKTNTLINKYKNAYKSTLEAEFRDKLDSVIGDGFSLLKEAILQNNASIKSSLLSEFEAILQANLQSIKSKIASIESTLNQSLEMIKNTDLETLKEQCKTKDKALKDIYNELAIITKALQ
ncbi:dynamin family protein [Helicobacter sp. T3_23-1056]